MTTKTIIKRLQKACACCAKTVRVFLYSDRSYRGGHFFGKIPVKNGKLAECWECPKCYWQG